MRRHNRLGHSVVKVKDRVGVELLRSIAVTLMTAFGAFETLAPPRENAC